MKTGSILLSIAYLASFSTALSQPVPPSQTTVIEDAPLIVAPRRPKNWRWHKFNQMQQRPAELPGLRASASTDALDAAVAAVKAELAAAAAQAVAYQAEIARLQAIIDSGNPPPPPPPPPPTGTFPDANPTWPQDCSALPPYTGSSTLSGVVEGKRLNGSFRAATNAIVRGNCITWVGSWGVDADGSNNVTLENNKVTGPGTSGANAGFLSGDNAKVLGNEFTNSENGVVMQGGTFEIRRNYIHALKAGSEGHYDGISIQAGTTSGLVTGNKVLSFDTSALFLKSDFGLVRNITADGNYFGNEPGKCTAFTVYSVSGNSAGAPTGTKLTNNKIERGHWGYYSLQGTVVRSGNTDAKTGANIDSPSGEGQARSC